MTQKPGGKGAEIKRALTDFVILILLLTGSGFGGYFYGIHQQLAPVDKVPPGTPGAILPPPISKPASDASAAASTSASHPGSDAGASTANSSSTASGAQSHPKLKYWLASSGTDYVGYNITVSVNDTPVDSFYGAGKTVNITNLVKPGDNTVTFAAKALSSEYNKHPGDKSAELKIQVVGGPTVQEDFKPDAVKGTFAKNATDSGDSTDAVHFTGE